MFMTRTVAGMSWVALMALGAATVSGQTFPTKPIRVATSAAGGGSDFMVRLVSAGVSSAIGQQVIVENRGEAVILADLGSKAPPDGYFLIMPGTSFWIGPLLQKLNYDPVSDFAPITLATRSPNLLVVHPSLPVKSVKELIALAKARPEALNYSSTGTGGAPHLAAELFNSMAGVKIVRINFKGGGPAGNALLAGEVQLSFASPTAVVPFIKSGRLRALAVSSARPSPLAPGLPTLAASGLPGYEVVTMVGLFAPAKTPAPVINRLNQEFARVLNQPDVKEKLFNAGVEAVGSSPEEWGAAVKSDMTRMGKVIKDAGIKAD